MKEQINEYKKFLADDTQANLQTRLRVKQNVLKYLQPPLKKLLPKFIFSLFAGGLTTLAICPQFGVGPLIQGHGIGHVFMQFGETACAAFCGAFYLSISTIVALLILKPHERMVIFDYHYRLLSGFSVATFLFFMVLNKSLELPSLYNSPSAFVAWLLSGLAASAIISRVSLSLTKS